MLLHGRKLMFCCVRVGVGGFFFAATLGVSSCCVMCAGGSGWTVSLIQGDLSSRLFCVRVGVGGLLCYYIGCKLMLCTGGSGWVVLLLHQA